MTFFSNFLKVVDCWALPMAEEHIEASSCSAMADSSAPAASQQPEDTEEAREIAIAYTANFVDGSQFDVPLRSTASVLDAVWAIAKQKGLPPGRLRLLVSGTPELLPVSSTVPIAEATGGTTELMVVVSGCYPLGTGRGPLAEVAREVTFEHYPSWAYLKASACAESELELCDGIQVRHFPSRDSRFPGILFAEGAPLSGRILIRLVVHSKPQFCALGMGVGTDSIDLNKDPEHDTGFLGLYHGGSSINVCNCGKRTYAHQGSSEHWTNDFRLAILLDIDQHTMQCFQCFADLKPFGPVVNLPDVPLWPAVVLDGRRSMGVRGTTSVSLSVSSV